MIKSILNTGTLLTKEVQQSIKGGDVSKTSPCLNSIYRCRQDQIIFYDYNLGRCSCKNKPHTDFATF